MFLSWVYRSKIRLLMYSAPSLGPRPVVVDDPFNRLSAYNERGNQLTVLFICKIKVETVPYMDGVHVQLRVVRVHRRSHLTN